VVRRRIVRDDLQEIRDVRDAIHRPRSTACWSRRHGCRGGCDIGRWPLSRRAADRRDLRSSPAHRGGGDASRATAGAVAGRAVFLLRARPTRSWRREAHLPSSHLLPGAPARLNGADRPAALLAARAPNRRTTSSSTTAPSGDVSE
jgi:hypothetical protein